MTIRPSATGSGTGSGADVGANHIRPSSGRPAGPPVHSEPRHEAGAIGAAEALGFRRHRRRRGPGFMGAYPITPTIADIGHPSQGWRPGLCMDVPPPPWANVIRPYKGVSGPRCARACIVGGAWIPRLAPWALDGRPLDGRGAWDRVWRRGESHP